MTTIVANSEGMASDSGLAMGSTVSSIKAKKIFRIKGHLVGTSGSCAQAAHLIYDLKATKDDPLSYLTDESEYSYDCHALILAPDGTIWYYDGNGIPFTSGEDYAVAGSGGTIAMAAMMAGAHPKEAAKIAIALDTKSNGKVKYVKL